MHKLAGATAITTICIIVLALSASPCSNSNGGNIFPKKFVLSWRDASDLDLQVTGPASRHAGFKLDAWKRTEPGQARLDTSRAPRGPETATIFSEGEGIYQFYVHDFTTRNKSSDNSLARSGARLDIYYGARLVKTLDVPPTGSGNVWTACSLYGDNVEELGTMSDASDPRMVGRTLRSALIPGDILFGRIPDSLVPGAWSHVAIYAGDGNVIEAASENENVGVRTETDWEYPGMTWVSYMRVVTADAATRQRAVAFAQDQVYKGCPYDIGFYAKQAHGGSWYCSELVWGAYLEASRGAIDLEYTPDNIGVYPWEIERSDNVQYVSGHYEKQPGRSVKVAWLYVKLVWNHVTGWIGDAWNWLWK